MNLKTFKVISEDSDGLQTAINVESLNEETLKREFSELKLGKLISYEEIDPETGKSIIDNKTQTKVKIDEKTPKALCKNNVVSETTWSEIKLQSGQIIRVSSNGQVQEQTWKDLTVETLYSDAKVRILKNGKAVSEFPKNYSFQKLIWVNQDASETK